MVTNVFVDDKGWQMNHATRFYNIINVTYNQEDIFTVGIKEFDSVIKNFMFLPDVKFANAVFIDDSALTTLNGKTHITNEKQEFLTHIAGLFNEYPDLKKNFLANLDSRIMV